MDSRARIEARLRAVPREFCTPNARWHVAVSHPSLNDILRATLFTDGGGSLRRDGDPPGTGELLPVSLASEIFILVQLHFPLGFTDDDGAPSRSGKRVFVAVHRHASAPVIVTYEPARAATGRPPTAAARLASLLINAAPIHLRFPAHHD